MRFYDHQMTFSPTDLVRFFESEFSSYMDHFEKIISENLRKKLGVHRDPLNPLYSLIIEMGNQHEKNMISKIEKTKSVTKIETDRSNRKASIEQTLSAMKKGAESIYQAAIQKDIIFGYADLIVKTKGKSLLGDHYYIPYDFKLSRNPKPTALIQLCCYCDILNSLQGVLPPSFIVVTKDGTSHSFKTDDFFYFYQFLKKQFLLYHSHLSTEHIPIPSKTAEHRDWSTFARKRLHTLNDISLIAGIRSVHIELLRKKNIKTLSELTQKKDLNIKGIPKNTLRVLIDQAWIQLGSIGKTKPEFKLLPHSGERRGLELLPLENKADVFFDMEGYPLLGKEGLEYLYGNTIEEDPKYISFWAANEQEEVNTFKKWLDWVYERWQQNPGMHIYHYGHYEVSTIKRLMGKYGIGEQKIDDMLRNSVFIDLHRIVIQSLRIGIFSYSIKEVEKLYAQKRDTDIQYGDHAAYLFSQFLNSNDEIEKSPFLAEIKTYNQEDCFSVKKLCQFLWNLQKKHNIPYIPFQEEGIEKYKPKNIKQECQTKAKELLSQVPLQKRNLHLSQVEKDLYISNILAHLLEFHIREDKPGWWDYFLRLDMKEEEMLEDRNTIVSCSLVSSSYGKYKIQFEKDQEISFDIGSTVSILENSIWETYTILDLDLLNGFLLLKPKRYHNIPSDKKFTLISEKNDFYKKNIFSSLLKTANHFSSQSPYFGLKKGIHDLLLKKSPDLSDSKGVFISNNDQLLEEISSLILNLKDSVFCIQGPPGCGKTYTAAHIILKLIKEQKRIGITANSHKAILNILKTINDQEKISFKCQKVIDSRNKTEEQLFFKDMSIELTTSGEVDLKAQLVGGTTFFFSRPNQESMYDYLFVDEASQVSLANIVAAGRATKNIILIGDQNQLDQPIQSSHPGESGLSALTYYTDGDTTISKEKGIFLPVSYRMHPSICNFISRRFYNEKLKSHPTTTHQKIIFPNSFKVENLSSENQKLLLPESGLFFTPVEHSGNAHSSIEEAKMISYIYKKLLKAKWVYRNKEIKPITTQDILIVSPYNFQVACLKKELKIEEARIGTVDKFQGQEAPICILSLASSTIHSAPRGISFLLNKNRLNVALSRARCLSIIVGSKNLVDTSLYSVPNLQLMNLWCDIVKTT